MYSKSASVHPKDVLTFIIVDFMAERSQFAALAGRAQQRYNFSAASQSLSSLNFLLVYAMTVSTYPWELWLGFALLNLMLFSGLCDNDSRFFFSHNCFLCFLVYLSFCCNSRKSSSSLYVNFPSFFWWCDSLLSGCMLVISSTRVRCLVSIWCFLCVVPKS